MPFVKVNLLPPRIKEARAKRIMVMAAVAAAVAVMSIPVGWWYVRWSALASMEAELKRVTKEAGRYGDVIGKNERLKASEVALAKKIGSLKKMVAEQSRWIRLLEVISFAQAEAQDMWLTNLTSKELKSGPDRGKLVIEIRGLAFSVASLDAFVKTLMDSALKPEIETEFGIKAAAGLAGRSIISFKVPMKLKV